MDKLYFVNVVFPWTGKGTVMPTMSEKIVAFDQPLSFYYVMCVYGLWLFLFLFCTIMFTGLLSL